MEKSQSPACNIITYNNMSLFKPHSYSFPYRDENTGVSKSAANLKQLLTGAALSVTDQDDENVLMWVSLLVLNLLALPLIFNCSDNS